MKGRHGHYVQKVEGGSPAESGGLRVGDRIIEVNGINIISDSHQQVSNNTTTEIDSCTAFAHAHNSNNANGN